MATVSECKTTIDPEPAASLAEVRTLYEQGLFLKAYQASREAGPLYTWSGTADILLAARLASQLAAPTLANWLIRRAWRSDPTNWETRFYNAFRILRRRGPYAAWRWTDQTGEPDATASAETQARWHALRGLAAGALRDFSVGESLLDRALSLSPGSAYAQLCRASLLEYEDRYEDALAISRQVLESDPTYVPAVECSSHLLTLLDRDQEAIELLNMASARFESGTVLAGLIRLSDGIETA